MPATRHGQGTPKRGAPSQGEKKVDKRAATQNNRNDAQGNKMLGTPKTSQGVEIVRSTRRLQAVPETSPVILRRTRGSNLEPVQEKEPAPGRRATRKDEVKSDDTVGPVKSLSTRNSKRAAESPEVVPVKKQKTTVTSTTRGAEAKNDLENLVEPKVHQEGEKVKEVGKSDAKSENESLIDHHKAVQKSLGNENKNSTAGSGLKSVTQRAGTTGSVSVADIMSPRRSSRAVIPNSRFKDMVDPGKRKSVIKTENVKEISVPAPKKQSVDYTSINVQQQGETNEIMEEIITEETKIDPLAQMNLMDDMLVLPSSSVGMSETMSVETEAERSNIGSTSIKVMKYPSAKVIRYQIDSKGITSVGSDVMAETTEETEDETSGERSGLTQSGDDDVAKTQNNFLPEETVPAPQVIVLPSDTGMRKIIIPKDPYRARLEQAFEKKGGSMVIGPSIGKTRAKKLIVTPTHQHVSKKEAYRTKMTEHGENRQDKESVVGKNLGKSGVTSVIYPWMQKPGISTGQIIHTPEKRQRYTVLPRKEHNNVTSVEVNPHGEEDSTELAGGNSGLSDGNISTVSSSAVNAAKVPNVRVVYVKAKQKAAPTTVSDSGKRSEQESNDRSDDNSALNEQIERTQEFDKADETRIDNSAENNREIDKIGHSDIEHTDKDSEEKEGTDSKEETKATEAAEEMTSVPVEQTIANSLCQVIEYKQQPQTAIEYVLLDNKMVPIHKPFQSGHHGRGHTGRRTEVVHRVTPGRVEPGGQTEQGVVKKIPLSTAQNAISTVISQIEDGQIQHVRSVPKSHIKYTIASRQQGTSDEELSEEAKTEVQQPRVVHGYIDHRVRSASPTQIVEISTEAFNKEVYGAEVTLDTVTGELIQGSVGTSPVEIIPLQTVVSVSEAGTVTLDNQSGQEEPDNQSMTEITQSVTVNTDDESAVIYTEVDEDRHVEEVTEWTAGTTVVSSDGNVLVSTAQATTGDNVVNIEGLDSARIPENATVTVEKLASGGEIVIMKIKETAVSETLEKIKTSQKISNESSLNASGSRVPSIVKATVIGKSPSEQDKKYQTNLRIAPVKKLPEVKITPVRAYDKSELQSRDKCESSTGAVSKTTGTNTVDSEAEYEEMEDEEEEEGITVEESGSSKSNPYQEYIVVRLPEGTEVKQFQARPKMEKTPLGEDITMDEEGMYVCVDCGHKTENRGNWFKHRRKHLGIRPHACPKCSYRAATSSNLKRHMQIHDDVRNFLCVYCNMLFRQKIHLERHLKYKHEEKNVQCPLCDYVCSSENPDLKNHIKRRHMPQEGALNAFTCDVCGLMTVSKKDLKQHKKFHKNGPELKLFCEHCSFVTDCVSRLRRHMLIHTKERPFQCGLCSYRATQKEHVLRHMRSQHGVEVERNQRRSLLEKNYSNPQEILVAGMEHTQGASLSEAAEADMGPFEKSDYSSTDKIFACNYCSMKFAKLINLYKHLYAQHKQVMPDEGPNDFQCVVCDFRTNNKKNLLVHMRKHNMQDHSPPTHVYSCVLCRYINPRRRNLFQHMKKKHGIEIIMKDDGLNCYVTLDNAAAQVQGQNVKSSVMALSDIVTTQTMDDATQMEFITETGDESTAFQAEKITIDNIIPDDMESYVVADSSQEQSMVSPQVSSISSVLHASVQEHEAAEAIEGLQALAEQAGILETQNIDNDMTSEIVPSAIEIVSTNVMNEGEVLNASDTMIKTEAPSVEHSAEVDEGFELSTEQLNQLATGDYVEINGEVYKVEIAPDGS
ncbi:uncharacterized protein LOC123552342 isoform X2 [Mercenaria mercenaria]|uniref:uncharacterized protein LOC123552342 isoform X2 n=1 Tax=Mercenaria mercenaria TaxID=6596 RepID=UPI00234E8877|nr:uncharacterized protein LOC123552342 isoform X2 [Mercenaria mercenaria]